MVARRYEFTFECSTRYLASEHNLLTTRFFTIFRRFPTIFRSFPKIFKMLSGGHTNVSENFPIFSEKFEDCRGRSEDDST